jgi:hypothetical protein
LKIQLFILLILPVFIGCSRENSEETKYQIVEFKKDIPLNSQNKNFNRFHIEFKLPQITSFPDGDVKDNVNFELNKYYFNNNGINLSKDPNRNFNNLVALISVQYQKEIKSLKNKLPNLSEASNYQLIKNGTVIYNKNKIFSISCEIYDFSGGAHGMNMIEYLHFDMNSGRRFGINELFDKDEKQKLIEMVTAKCEEMKKDKSSELFEDSKIEDCDNFYFDDMNFIFVYNPYEIGPYSAGFIHIEIPISEIRPLLKKDIHPGF